MRSSYSSARYDIGHKLASINPDGIQKEYVAVGRGADESSCGAYDRWSYQNAGDEGGGYQVANPCPGFAIDSTALWNEESSRGVRTLSRRFASPEHSESRREVSLPHDPKLYEPGLRHNK